MKPIGRATKWVNSKSHGVRYCRNQLCCGWSVKPYKRTMSKARRRDLAVGTEIEFQDEGEGVITDETEDSIFIVSRFFTGWMYKAEYFDLLGYE